ncbi:redoxin domain-containing protein [Pseudomonas aeruginosa]|nr:redoxin domain-containing protein [Pseudomonas aeruginosa]MCT7339652.1 redoxin domain-containing protein [Pseudomonas aeruginosa]MDF5949728.1 redoxin domain-containing protein [Pseudomonas aeruginosa]
MPVAIDKPVPDFTAPATSGKEVTLSALKGKQVVLYFYPKDSTPVAPPRARASATSTRRSRRPIPRSSASPATA